MAPPWPGRPSAARDLGEYWYVQRLPPDPFPTEGTDYGDDGRWGPPGTKWAFTYQQLFDHALLPGTSAAVKAGIAKLLKKFGTVRPPDVWTIWSVPLGLADPAIAVELEEPMPMNWIRTAIGGAIGTDEEIVHVINWRHSTTENAPVTAAELKAFGNVVRDKYQSFMSNQRAKFATVLEYKEVRTSLLTQAAPGVKPLWPLPTQVAPFGGAAGGSIGTGTGSPLPYEVALGLSLNTNFRGTARFRGRVYLGPMDSTNLGTQGDFNPVPIRAVALAFGEMLGAVETATDYECHVISQKYNTSAKVTGVRVGQVPDSQRRRRRDRPELHFQAWGTPVGAL